MNPAGLALFLLVAAMNAPLVQQAVLSPPPPVVSPDPAPPHPLKPRHPEEIRMNTPAATLARVLGAIAQGVLRDHGH